jgi:hypothetical protein
MNNLFDRGLTGGSDAKLVSLNTWMKVEEAEQRDAQSRPIDPR